MSRTRMFLVAVLSLAALPVQAEPEMPQPPAAPAGCTAVDDATLPPALAAWTTREPLAGATSAAELPKAALEIGKAVDAQLRRNGEVDFPVVPTRPGGTASYGGLFDLRVAEAGAYRVSLGSSAWIEIVSGKSLLAANAHASGPVCTSLRKIVTFSLKAGRYVLAVTGNGEPTVPLMVTRLPR